MSSQTHGNIDLDAKCEVRARHVDLKHIFQDHKLNYEWTI